MSQLLACVAMLVVVVTIGGVRAQDNPQLPVPEDLFRAVRANLVRAETVAHLYAFKERRTDVHTNPFGRIGTGGTKLYDVYPSPIRQLTYRRLIARDGVSLTPAELAEQDSRYRERVAERQREQATRGAEEERQRETDAARARERRQRRVEDIVNVLQFTLEGRTVYEGVPAYIVSFVPKPDAKPATREGRTAVNFEGKIWIGEATSEVMQVEATSIDDITFGFGLVARVGKGAHASMTRRQVAGDLWMPTRIALSGRGRAVLLRTLVLDFEVDWFDYRRLDGDSATPFLDSGVQPQSSRRPE
jgi:hypothetical protein